jgi:diguanylate cyclase (GGDEF)-like protein
MCAGILNRLLARLSTEWATARSEAPQKAAHPHRQRPVALNPGENCTVIATADEGLRRASRLLERLPTERPPPELREPLAERLDQHAARYVIPVSAFLFFFYALLVPTHLFWPGGGLDREILGAVSLGCCIFFGVIGLTLRRTGVSPDAAHPLLFISALLPLAGSLLHIGLTADPIHTTNVMLVSLAAGAFLLQLRWFFWIQALAIWGWICVALLSGDELSGWGHFGVGMILAAGTSMIVFTLHREGLKGLELLNLKLSDLAALDSLTGIANRRWFDARLHASWSRHARDGESLALLMCDIDHFKNLNDTRGHGAGDVALRQVAGILRASARSEDDLPARLGGEEFAVLLPHTTEEQAMLVAERIRTGVRSLNIPNPGIEPDDATTISIGVAALVPKASIPAQRLLNLADEALYAAKRDGRNRSVSRTQPLRQ